MYDLLSVKRRLADNWKRLNDRVAEACRHVGRDPDTVKIVAVTKSATIDVIRALVELGVADLGESRVQELSRRAAMLNEWLNRRGGDLAAGALLRPRWHMIGHLQRNKVKTVLPWVGMIHSVDSLRLAEEIDVQIAALDRRMPVLLQVNASDEKQKFGVAVAATTHLAEQIHTLPHLEIRGLMAMAPLTDDGEVIRRCFIRVRELFDEIVGAKLCGPTFTELSLGMSHDFEYGIEAGATYVRIGSALFEGIELPPAIEE